MNTPQITEITDGLQFPEGPVVMADGTVIVVELMGAWVTRVHPDGKKEPVATPGGGRSAAARASTPTAKRTPAPPRVAFRTAPPSAPTARCTSATAAAGLSEASWASRSP